METRTFSRSEPFLVVCPTLRRPANVARIQQSFHDTATAATGLRFVLGERNCVEKVNEAAAVAVNAGIQAVMFVGDDHVFATRGWDKLILDALAARPGVVWPDVPGDRYCHPVVWAMSASMIRALGWFMLPTQRHYYVDDAIAQIGIRAGVATWLEDVKVPHLHYRLTGQPSDSVYERAQGWLDEDRDNYWKWLREDSEAVVERVRGAMFQ